MRFSDIIEVYRATVVNDEYGSHRNWKTPRRIISTTGVVIPQWSSEPGDIDRELSEISVDIYLKPVDVKASDRVKVNGTFYEVYGSPITWKGRTAQYMRIRARRVTNV
jgi:hypothetical protein